MYLSFADAVASKFGGGARVWELARSAVDQMGLDMTRRQLQATQGATPTEYPAQQAPRHARSDIGVSSRSSLHVLFVRLDFIAPSDFFLYSYISVGSIVSRIHCLVFFFIIDSSTFLHHCAHFLSVSDFIAFRRFRIVFIRRQLLSVFTTVSFHRL